MTAGILLYIGRRLEQPLIPVYILAGILLGQNFLGVLGGSDAVLAMAELGIIFLLFTAGLETELNEIRDLGSVIILAGVVHTVIAALLGFLLSALMGFDTVSAMYIGLFVAFSSTMEVLNILEKRFEITTLHGRIIMGILLIEDFIAIIAISGIGSFGSGFDPLISATINAVGLFSIALVVSRYVTPYVFDKIETTNESLLMAALSFCFIFMGISRFSGIPIAVGAFCGGLSLTKFPYGIEIRNNIKSLRDFFGTVFFVSLGALASFSGIRDLLLPLTVLSLLVIVIKPAMTYLMMSSHGYGQRTSFLTGLGLGQVSEFSLFIVLEGLLAGVLPESVFLLCLGVAIVTITISSYSYRHHGVLYDYFSDSLIDIKSVWSRETIHEMKHVPEDLENHIILV
ncbi:MAG: cation:proton antiporter, partial [Candidatus Nanohaloarchaea archaeon]|nr:cation:proton antiporter [Candidatus Nanohaloarchaea archaeon]